MGADAINNVVNLHGRQKVQGKNNNQNQAQNNPQKAKQYPQSKETEMEANKNPLNIQNQ